MYITDSPEIWVNMQENLGLNVCRRVPFLRKPITWPATIKTLKHVRCSANEPQNQFIPISPVPHQVCAVWIDFLLMNVMHFESHPYALQCSSRLIAEYTSVLQLFAYSIPKAAPSKPQICGQSMMLDFSGNLLLKAGWISTTHTMEKFSRVK